MNAWEDVPQIDEAELYEWAELHIEPLSSGLHVRTKLKTPAWKYLTAGCGLLILCCFAVLYFFPELPR